MEVCSLAGDAEIVGDAASVGGAFHAVHVPVHGAVARRAVGVEIALGQEAGDMVAQHAQVTLGFAL